MENTRNTKPKKDTLKKYNVHLADDLTHLIPPELNKFQTTKSKNTAHIIISSLDIDLLKVELHLTNDLQDFNTDPAKLRVFLELLPPLTHNSTKVHDQNTSHLKYSTLGVDFQLIFNSSSTYSKYLTKCLELKSMSSYSNIHFFHHAKGDNYATHTKIARDNVACNSIETVEFNELFNAIKKSKNRSFGQNNFSASNYNIVGTCIAREFTLKDYNIILIFSQGSLIPLDDDVDFIEQITPFIIFHLNLYLSISTQVLFNSLKSQLKNFLIKDVNQQYKADINHLERMTLMGELLNILKHELSNPLFGLQLTSELLSMEEMEEDHLIFLKQINSSLLRSKEIIENFSSFFSNNTTQSFSLSKLIGEVITLTKSESRGITFEQTINNDEVVSTSDSFLITSNPTFLAQIVFNLIINSAQALKEMKIKSPKISINIQLHDELQISISDNGPGLSPEVEKNCFSAFYTTKGSGTGLGLAISKNLADKLNGTLSYIPSKQGANFLLRIPL